MKFLVTNAWQSDKKLRELGATVNYEGALYFLSGGATKLIKEKKVFAFIEGYLRDLNKKVQDIKGQNESVISAISQQWPCAENITGSFSAVTVDLKEKVVTLCTDQVGLYPLYYLKYRNNWFISNSIIWMGVVSKAPFDPAGIVQRSLGPEFANLGSRTILKKCYRLLPGERIQMDEKGEILSRTYDNRLFEKIGDSSVSKAEANQYWEAYKKEVEYCTNYSENVNIALSGGIDSRIALGAIPRKKKIICYTYGASKNYETEVARKLANIKEAEFHSCSIPELYFPSPAVLDKYTFQTEGVELCSWLEITESVFEKKEEPLLLGELCEALPGRNIKNYSGKDFKKNNFYKSFILKKDFIFTPADEINFEQWKKNKIHQFKLYYIDRHLEKYDFHIDKEELIEALLLNLNELFSRIEAHNLPYSELYDELFSWYTYTRMHLSKHLLVAGSKFHAYSPAMSLQMLTRTSRLHPNVRLNYRFAQKLFENNKELRVLSKVPTAQAPLVPQNYPAIMKFAIWGVRSIADQQLIKRMMKNKDVGNRYRLFKSINWPQVYQLPDMEENIKGYFDPNEVGQLFFDALYEQAKARRDLDQWPFANMNIMNAASLNTEMKIIKQMRTV